MRKRRVVQPRPMQGETERTRYSQGRVKVTALSERWENELTKAATREGETKGVKITITKGVSDRGGPENERTRAKGKFQNVDAQRGESEESKE